MERKSAITTNLQSVWRRRLWGEEELLCTHPSADMSLCDRLKCQKLIQSKAMLWLSSNRYPHMHFYTPELHCSVHWVKTGQDTFPKKPLIDMKHELVSTPLCMFPHLNDAYVSTPLYMFPRPYVCPFNLVVRLFPHHSVCSHIPMHVPHPNLCSHAPLYVPTLHVQYVPTSLCMFPHAMYVPTPHVCSHSPMFLNF